MKLTGILSQSLGGIYTFRGYSNYTDIISTSYPHSGYQRPVDQLHLDELVAFISEGKNSFSPEVVLSYTLRYDYSKTGQRPTTDPITDLVAGITFRSNVDGFVIKQNKLLECGRLCTMTLPDKAYNCPEERPFRRVDGNHRLQAIERVIAEEKSLGTYIIPFCILLFMEDDSLKSEKVIFHNINSKALPIRSEQLLKGILSPDSEPLSFSDSELNKDFGKEYSFARKIVQNNSMLLSKFRSIEWIGVENMLSTLIDLIYYIEYESKSPITEGEQEQAFCQALSRALREGRTIGDKLMLSSGLLYILAYSFYQDELGIKGDFCINDLLAWSNKYDIASLQVQRAKNGTENANCLRNVFKQYMQATIHTIFLSRCFADEFNENERAVQRVILEINNEKNVNIKLQRVDRHSEGKSADIYGRIEKGISNCGLVIADLSGGKANVHHEIGLAMGMRKPLILIHRGTNEEADLHTPSNIKMYDQIRFGNTDYKKLEEDIKTKIIDFYQI